MTTYTVIWYEPAQHETFWGGDCDFEDASFEMCAFDNFPDASACMTKIYFELQKRNGTQYHYSERVITVLIDGRVDEQFTEQARLVSIASAKEMLAEYDLQRERDRIAKDQEAIKIKEENDRKLYLLLKEKYG